MEVKNVCKSYNGEKVLNNVSLYIGDGETALISGVSGIGKTTLLRIMMGLEKADSGEIIGVPGKIAAVFQEDRLPEKFIPVACVKMTAPKAVSKKMIYSHLREVGLGEHLDKPVSKLSGGMRRRVAIVRAIICDADVIFLDEPFNGLDRETKLNTIAYIKKHTLGKTLIAVSHNAEDAQLLGAKEIRI